MQRTCSARCQRPGRAAVLASQAAPKGKAGEQGQSLPQQWGWVGSAQNRLQPPPCPQAPAPALLCTPSTCCPCTLQPGTRRHLRTHFLMHQLDLNKQTNKKPLVTPPKLILGAPSLTKNEFCSDFIFPFIVSVIRQY